jgi:hypothetical protein
MLKRAIDSTAAGILAVALICTLGAGWTVEVLSHSPPNRPGPYGYSDNRSKPPDNYGNGTFGAPVAVEVFNAPKTPGLAAQEETEKENKTENERLLVWFTGVLAAFTAALWLATYRLARDSIRAVEASESSAIVARDTLKHLKEASRRELRAYIICGGLYGVPKNPGMVTKRHYRNKATDFTGSWRLAICNLGRTPGTITTIEWGICPDGNFPRGVSVSDGTLNITVAAVHEAYFPNPEGTESRHVICDRLEGTVFYGRIRYTDVFKKPCHSTFALLHGKNHSDSLEGTYAEDWS